MSFGVNNSGSERLTSDGAVGTSGAPVRLFNVTWLSGSGGAGEIVLRNGTSASDTAYIQQDGTAASKTTVLNFEDGLLFPDGCFFDKDSNVDAAVFQFRVEA